MGIRIVRYEYNYLRNMRKNYRKEKYGNNYLNSRKEKLLLIISLLIILVIMNPKQERSTYKKIWNNGSDNK